MLSLALLDLPHMLIYVVHNHMGLDARKPVFDGLRPTKALTRRNSAFVIRFLESIISKLATNEIPIF